MHASPISLPFGLSLFLIQSLYKQFQFLFVKVALSLADKESKCYFSCKYLDLVLNKEWESQ
ncbi:hypothetical protein ES288_A12G237800v1 [Gossypium darwinii]|uniref:Uncharacterized protein n=1 Tax=Gossypium darwinii TaxID=34276 RepID=A0A5D2ED57_GOSDA|nr:hypothetical protein ES288_A12G237800v1 [Gossypium darwinii]